jgi:hypothetical protein
MGNKAAVDRLDGDSGSKMVAASAGRTGCQYSQRRNRLICLRIEWSWREESNLQPAVYKTAALPIELRQPCCGE